MPPLGLGIHGEPGVARIKHDTLDNLVARMLRLMTTDGEGMLTSRMLTIADHDSCLVELDTEAFSLQPEQEVVVLINNLGGSSVLEMSMVAKAVLQALHADYGCKVLRVYNSSFMTYASAPGLSYTRTPTLLHM